uniref:Uncharacterized protein n=1 Tax=Romanomermis culicivorax TaxID=13658 RepID=A0A915HPZ8_ROMCU
MTNLLENTYACCRRYCAICILCCVPVMEMMRSLAPCSNGSTTTAFHRKTIVKPGYLHIPDGENMNGVSGQ